MAAGSDVRSLPLLGAAWDLHAVLHFGSWVVELDRSKTDALAGGRATAIGALEGEVCPARAFREFLAYRWDRFAQRADLWSPEAPLFVDKDGAGLSDKRFHKAVRSIAEAAGLPGGGSYMSHSGRIGGASAAEAAGISRAQVMLAGGSVAERPGEYGVCAPSCVGARGAAAGYGIWQSGGRGPAGAFAGEDTAGP